MIILLVHVTRVQKAWYIQGGCVNVGHILTTRRPFKSFRMYRSGSPTASSSVTVVTCDRTPFSSTTLIISDTRRRLATRLPTIDSSLKTKSNALKRSSSVGKPMMLHTPLIRSSFRLHFIASKLSVQIITAARPPSPAKLTTSSTAFGSL